MFSLQEKRTIAAKIEEILLALKHPEMPTEKPFFQLHVDGKESWSWADIQPNWTFDDKKPATTTPWNESARKVLESEPTRE